MPGRVAVGWRRRAAMAGDDAALAAAVEHGVDGDHTALLEDADLGRGAVNLDGAAPGRIGYAVEVAVYRDHTVAGDTPFETQYGLEWPGRVRL